MRKLTLVVLLSVVVWPQLRAQEMWGIVNSNFAGNTGVDINPASLVGMPMTSEFHLMSGDLFLYNNYIYLPEGSFALEKMLSGSLNQENLSDRYIDDPLKRAYVNASFKGPSFLWSKSTWGLSIHTGIRNQISAENYPYHVAKFNWEGIDYQPQHGINYSGEDIRATAISYGELGINYGRALIKTSDNMLSAGIGIRSLLGFQSFYAKVDELNYTIPIKEVLIVPNVTMDYGHAVADSEGEGSSNPMKIRGTGWAGNLGLSFQKGRQDRAYEKTAKRYKPMKMYDYRIGVSLIDWGSINWKNEAKQFAFEEASTIWPGFDTVKFENLNYTDSILSVQFTGDATQSYVTDQYRTFLPAALSAQFDVALFPRVYANLSGLVGLNRNDPSVRRPDQISLTARYETRWFEVAIPYSFYEYEQHRLGIAVRWGPLLIGSDRVGAFTGIDDTDGIDFYFALKWAAFNGERGAKTNPCFAF